MRQEINVKVVKETNHVSLSNVKVGTIDKEHPCGEHEPAMKTLGLDVINNPSEGSLLFNLKNEKGEVFLKIILKHGYMSLKRVAKRPRDKPSETQELCETVHMGLQWLCQADQKKIRSHPVRIVVGEFRLEV